MKEILNLIAETNSVFYTAVFNAEGDVIIEHESQQVDRASLQYLFLKVKDSISEFRTKGKNLNHYQSVFETSNGVFIFQPLEDNYLLVLSRNGVFAGELRLTIQKALALAKRKG